MKIEKVVLAILTLAFTLVSCEKEETEALPLGDYEKGILIANEGPFSNGTGTVSFISDDFATQESEIFNKVNGTDLGNIVQSIGFDGDNAFVIANVSNKINIVNRYTFESIATIEEGLSNPRYFVAVNGKGYVTNWGDSADETDDFIAVINLTNNTVESTIPVVLGPERIIANRNTVYVAHKGAFGFNNKISVISASTNTVDAVIEVTDVPNSLQFDAGGSLWVLSSGMPSWSAAESAGALTKINISTNTVERTLTFPSVTDHPSSLSVENEKAYYANSNAVYAFGVSDTALPTTPIINEVSFYAMTVFNGHIYGTDAKDYASNGDLHIYDISNNYSLQTFSVGIIPGAVYAN